MNEITLCLMVKDEQRYLEKCLESVKPYVDDMIIIDTGSTDSTIEIAKRYTENVSSIPFGGDFSAIRNAAIEKVKTPWILFLDADEEFEESEISKLKDLLSNTPEDVAGYKVFRYNFFSTGGWYSGTNLKVFRNHPEIRYRKKVNETVQMSIEDLGLQVLDAPIVLNHFGHCRTVEERNNKSYKYMRLMEEQLKETPDDAFLEGYIGLISRTVGNFSEALTRSERAVEMNPTSATMHSFRGHVLRSTGNNEEALKSYKKAAELRPNDSSAWNMIGIIELTLGRYEEAYNTFKHAFNLNPIQVHVLINMGIAQECLGNIEKALEHYQRVAKKNKGFLRQSWVGLTECDPYRPFYYETIMQYPGLGRLLGSAKFLLEQNEQENNV